MRIWKNSISDFPGNTVVSVRSILQGDSGLFVLPNRGGWLVSERSARARALAQGYHINSVALYKSL